MDRPLKKARFARHSKYLLASALVSVVVVALFSLLNTDLKTKRINSEDIRSGIVERGDLEVAVVGSGEVIANKPQWVTAKVNGIVQQVLIEEGDSVTQGQTILVLQNEEVESGLNTALALLAGEKASLASANAELHTRKSDYEAELAQATAELALASDIFHMQTELMKIANSPISRLDYLTARSKLEVAKARLTAAKIKMASIGEVTRAKRQQHEHQIERREMDAARLKTQNEYLTVKAHPELGVVQAFNAEVGQHLKVGDVVGQIVNLGDCYVRLRLPASKSSYLRPGQKALVTVASKSYEAVTKRVASNVEGTTIQVDLELAESDRGVLRIGLYVTGTVFVEKIPDTLWLKRPASAVENGEMSIFRYSDDKYLERIKIKVGALSDDKMQILDGLNLGDRIVISDVTDFMSYQSLIVN